MLKKIRSLVSNSDFIEIYDNALSPEDCQRLIKLWQSREKVDGWCYSGKVPVINPEIKKGKELGNLTENGEKMFIYQAFEAFKLWHDVEPVVNFETLKLLK